MKKTCLILSLLLLPLVARADAPVSKPVTERPYKSVVYSHEKTATNSKDKEEKPK